VNDMNEQIRELWDKANIRYSVYETLKPRDERKVIPELFAESIVKECAEIALTDGQVTGNFDTFNKIQKHFGAKE